MPSADQVVQAYRELAASYHHQGQAPMRDRFLVLAADAAFTAGRHDQAEQLRADLLRHNPHHLLKPYRSFAEAMKSADVQNYVSALRRSHPYERVRKLIDALCEKSPNQEPGEDEKIFRLSDRPAQPTRDVPAAYATRPYDRPPLASAASAQRPQVSRLDRRMEANRGSMADDELGADITNWVSLGLFTLVLLAGLGLAVYTFARPFLRVWGW